MKQSQLFFKTRKETPADADSINASYLVRAGFVEKQMAGVYALLPLGFKVAEKIKDIVREEMNQIGGQELIMNSMQPKELWQKTGRWEALDDVMYKSGEGKNEIGFAATHEEQITEIAKNHISSYKDLPLALYQIQTKFRNEPRAKSGLLRGREFVMKDLYSFHTSEEDFLDFYEKSKVAYTNVYNRLGLKTKIAEADGGAFTEKHSHEFQVLTPVGEDTIYYCDKCDFAQNKEIATVKEGDKCPKCGGKVKVDNGIEVGNIFPLETKYSSALGAKFADREGKDRDTIMGCYGIGITRSLATVVEVHYNATKNKMVWPEEIAPFQIHLISLNQNEAATPIYESLAEMGAEILYDDRDISAGQKFAEADLIGCPQRVVISAKTLEQDCAEVIDPITDEKELVKITDLF